MLVVLVRRKVISSYYAQSEAERDCNITSPLHSSSNVIMIVSFYLKGFCHDDSASLAIQSEILQLTAK